MSCEFEDTRYVCTAAECLCSGNEHCECWVVPLKGRRMPGPPHPVCGLCGGEMKLIDVDTGATIKEAS